MDNRRPVAWYDEGRGEDAPFAAFYTMAPSENPTVRPQRAPTADPLDAVEALAREENLVIIARRSRPILR